MKLSTRLIIKSVIPMVLLAWLVLLAIMTLMELRDQLTSVRGQTSSISQALGMLLLTTPRRAFEHFVYAAVIGSAIGLGQLAQSSELIAMRAVGLSKLRIVAAALGGVLVLTLLAMGASELLSAAGDRRAQALAAGKDGGQIGVTQRSGLWLKDGADFVNAKRAVLNESGKPVELWDFRLLRFNAAGRLEALLLAQSAVYLEGQGWQLRQVIQQGLDGAPSSKVAELPWKSTLMPEQIASRTLRPARQPLQEIWQNLAYARANNLDQQAFVSALWQRLTFPLSVLALVLATTPFAFSSLRTGGLGRSIFIGVMLAVVFFVLQKLIVSLFDAYGWNMAIAYLLPSALIGGFSLWRLRQD
jgi:lipopolysaccharide export system permease protein